MLWWKWSLKTIRLCSWDNSLQKQLFLLLLMQLNSIRMYWLRKRREEWLLFHSTGLSSWMPYVMPCTKNFMKYYSSVRKMQRLAVSYWLVPEKRHSPLEQISKRWKISNTLRHTSQTCSLGGKTLQRPENPWSVQLMAMLSAEAVNWLWCVTSWLLERMRNSDNQRST